MNNQYENYLRNIYENGNTKTDRTGTGTRSLFGLQMRFNLQEGFPLITTKKVHLKSIVHELLWFLSGSTNIKYLQDNGVKIWDEWADENGELGPIYGYQWRSWPGSIKNDYGSPGNPRSGHVSFVQGHGECYEYYQEGIDQISNLLEQLHNNPDSRRLIVSAWNPAQVDQMKLPPCHCLFQFYTRELTVHERFAHMETNLSDYNRKGYTLVDPEVSDFLDELGIPKRALSCQLYQRSADSVLGVPFNIASYALLTEMIAQQVNMIPDEFIWTGGDCHIYSNHFEQVELQLSREPFPYPKLLLNKAADIFSYKFEDIDIERYQHHDAIKAPVAV